jgi:DNA-binding response OmpR family regulator
MPLRKKTILVVDDEDAVRDLVRAMLMGAGYRVLQAKDFEDALAVFHQHEQEVDLLLADLSLPGKNGCELAETLQQKRPDLQVLFMSGLAGAQAARYHGLAITDVHFLEKPFRSVDLLERIAYALRWARPRSGSASA